MSTKIYNGLKIRADSLDDAISFISKGKPFIVNYYEQAEIKKEFLTSVYVLTEYLINQPEILKEHFNIDLAIQKQDIDENASAMGVSFAKVLDATDDVNISFVIFPEKLTIKGNSHYLMTVNADNTIKDVMLKKYEKKISEYFYWNNTDIPDDLTQQEWQEREKNWEHVLLSKSSIPSVEGLTIKFISNSQPTAYLSPEQRLKNLDEMCKQSRESSYKNYAVNHMVTDMMLQILKNDKECDIKSTFALIQKVREKNFNDKELAQYEKLESIVNKMVPDELTPEIMRTKLVQLKENLNSKAINDKLEAELVLKNKIKTKKL